MGQHPTSDRERTAEGRVLLCLPKQFLAPSLLLLIDEEPAYGYELLQRLAAFGVSSTDHGAIYRALNVMETDGLVSSSWERSSSGPRRRRYRATDEGRRVLVCWSTSLERADGLIRRFLDRYACSVLPPLRGAEDALTRDGGAAALTY